MATKTIPISLLIIMLLLAGCSQTEPAPTATPTAVALTEAPNEVLQAREAVLNFLRDGANECVPPRRVVWNVSPGNGPAGFAVYRFRHEQCLLTVAGSQAAPAAGFHVALHNDAIGFCWQALVDADGRVAATGSAASLPSELAEAAAAYCQAQGYSYQVQVQADGSQCGVCVFSETSACKAWLFYQGECAPGDNQ